MITKKEAQAWADSFRAEGFRILDDRDRLEATGIDLHGAFDETASSAFQDAARMQALADGPWWKRWLA